jgi:hypothetical protein
MPVNYGSQSSSIPPHPQAPSEHPIDRRQTAWQFSKARPGDRLRVNIIRPGSRSLLVGIGSNQAGIDRKGSPIDQPFGHAAPDHGLEQLSQQIAVPEPTMPILGEGRVVRHLAVEAEPTEPAVSEVQVNLLAQPPLRTNAVSSSLLATSGRAVRDQSKAGR